MRSTLTLAVLALALASLANAQATRAWVSGVGNDMNPCSRTAPCLTFAGALAKTAAGGEINCVDTGDFGFVNITQSVTIDCGGTSGSIGLSPGNTGITINAGASDVVTLRNLSISRGGPASTGILYLAARAVHVENVRVSVVSASDPVVCIALATNAASLLTVDSATLSDCHTGIFALTSSGTAVVNVNNTRIANTTFGMRAENGSRVTIRDSSIYFNQIGVEQISNVGSNLGSTVTVVNSTLGFSSTAALQSLAGEFILAFGNTFVNNVLDFNPNGGTIFTGSDNNNSGSAPGAANGGTVPRI